MPALHLTLESPIGNLLLTARDEGLTGVWFEQHRHAPQERGSEAVTASSTSEAARILRSAADQLAEYFAGERRQFTLALAARGTPFQLQVWRALASIPYGSAVSYAWLAERVEKPTAIRAVGGANARNPLSIVVPCHRVIGANGSLTGFGGGLERKRWLLEHEGALQAALAATA
ncbi:MAG TPA: methylated-DNA--[protein]-cysteine S-methyltransferase [Gemmatimonadales bacterium]|nr:methylated-DNA--[protein]-cysteine S-methyltransferase [Gemmatimonadales bacterium]